MNTRSTLLLLLFLVSSNVSTACWLDQKEKSIKRVEWYMRKRGLDPKDGLSRHSIEDAVRTAPSSIRWVIDKVHGVDGVLRDCDLNHDSVIHMDEARLAKHCCDSCFKQLAILSFLN